MSKNARTKKNRHKRMFAMTTSEFDLVIASMLLAATKSWPVRELVSKLVDQFTGWQIVPPEAANRKRPRPGRDLIVHANVEKDNVIAYATKAEAEAPETA